MSRWFSDTPTPHVGGWGPENNGYVMQLERYIYVSRKYFCFLVFVDYFILFLHKKTGSIFLGSHSIQMVPKLAALPKQILDDISRDI